MSTATDLRGRLSRPDRETVTRYGGLFLVVLFGYGIGGALFLEFGADPMFVLFTGLTLGYLPALFAVGYLAAHRYYHTPTSA